MKNLFSGLVLTVLLVIGMSWVNSCKPSTPGEYLSESEMADVLYDYHIAMGMLYADRSSGSNENRAYDEKLYKLAVLKKHGITEKDFDASMVYYMRHADQMQSVYKSLDKRMKDEASSIGASTVVSSSGLASDTVNVWPLDRSFVLMQNQPYNVIPFELKTDTAFHKGDRINLGFDAQFLFQEGFKDGIAILALRFANDSVTSRIVHFSSNSRYELDITDTGQLGIKEISGFIYLNKEVKAQTTTTMKILVLNRIQLLRIHQQPKITETPKDSLQNKESSKPLPADSVEERSVSADAPNRPLNGPDRLEGRSDKPLDRPERTIRRSENATFRR